MVRATAIIALVLVSCLSSAQEIPPGYDLIRYIGNMALFDEERSMDELNDELSSLMDDPVDINSNDETEIGRIFFLTPFQVKSIVDYTKKNGRLISIYELAYIPGFDPELASLLAPCIKIINDNERSTGRSHSSRIIANYLPGKQADNTGPGTDAKMLAKVRIPAGDVLVGFTAEKDRGELLIDDNGRPDFFSAYLNIRNKGIIREITLGDFAARFGQGLVAWTGYSTGLLPTARNPMKGMSSTKPYTSTDENNFYRGIAISSKVNSININGFVSRKPVDASVNFDDSGNPLSVISFPADGLHTSQGSLIKKDAVNESSAGLNINQIWERISLGLSMQGTWFDIPVDPGNGTREIYDFRGNSNFSLSLDHAVSLHALYFYGEYAFNPGNGYAFIQGLRLRPSPRVDMNILVSETGKGYNSFHGSICGDATVNSFSRNILTNITMEVAPNTFLSAGITGKSDNWIASYSGAPALSLRYGVTALYDPGEQIKVTLDYNLKRSPVSLTPETGIRTTVYNILHSARATINIDPGSTISLATRFHFTEIEGSGERGLMCYQSVRIKPLAIPVEATLRFSVFNTGNYQTRIYAWEDDLLYSTTFTPLWGTGTRNYLLVKYSPIKDLVLRARYSFTDRLSDDGERIITGEFRFQVILNLSLPNV